MNETFHVSGGSICGSTALDLDLHLSSNKLRMCVITVCQYKHIILSQLKFQEVAIQLTRKKDIDLQPCEITKS